MNGPRLEFGPVQPADGPDPAPESPARRRRVVLLAAAGVAVAASLGVTAAYGPAAWRMYQQRDATLSTPAQVAGLRLDESRQARETADYLQTALAAAVAVGDTVGAVYTDGAGPTRSIIFVGGTGMLRSPDQDLDRALRSLADGQVEQLRPVPAGDLGGTMLCGRTAGADGLTVCGWADHGSLAVALFPQRTFDEGAELLRAIRAATQRRG